MLRGVDPLNEAKVSKLPDEVKEGKFDLTGRGVLVGLDFAENLHLRVGDTLSIYSIREFKKMKQAHVPMIVCDPDSLAGDSLIALSRSFHSRGAARAAH